MTLKERGKITHRKQVYFALQVIDLRLNLLVYHIYADLQRKEN